MATDSPASPLHALLLLSDSALPLGSFAFSSGLESFLAHQKATLSTLNATARLEAFARFLEQSVQNVASTALPYVMRAYDDASRLEDLDNDFDASTPCTVARRASVAQGRALLTLWERAFMSTAASDGASTTEAASTDMAAASSKAVARMNAAIKAGTLDAFGLPLNAHFPPLFGAVCRALKLSASNTAYLFLLNHAKAVLSAAVRASVMGPYQSHAMLAGSRLQICLQTCIVNEQSKTPCDAAVTIPMMDLWMGRHELLYSRIFNS